MEVLFYNCLNFVSLISKLWFCLNSRARENISNRLPLLFWTAYFLLNPLYLHKLPLRNSNNLTWKTNVRKYVTVALRKVQRLMFIRRLEEPFFISSFIVWVALRTFKCFTFFSSITWEQRTPTLLNYPETLHFTVCKHGSQSQPNILSRVVGIFYLTRRKKKKKKDSKYYFRLRHKQFLLTLMGVLKLMPEALYQNITWRLEKLFLFLHSKKMSFFFFSLKMKKQPSSATHI